jgi:hypothetical protein
MTQEPPQKDYREIARKVVEQLYENDGHLRAMENRRRPNDSEPYDFDAIEEAFMDGLGDHVDAFLNGIEEADDKHSPENNNQ